MLSGELELVGAIIGDGHIHCKNSKYYFGLTGNKITDKLYFVKLAGLIKTVWKKETGVFESKGGLRIRVYSKAIVNRLINFFKIPFNSGKCYSVCIPENVILDFNLCKHVLRGITDTDGSVFVSDKKGAKNYPSLEITTVSQKLAFQIRQVLLENGFRVANLRKYKSKLATQFAFKICLYGRANLKKWVEQIGFSNPVKLGKAYAALGDPF